MLAGAGGVFDSQTKAPRPYLDDAPLPLTLILHAQVNRPEGARFTGLLYELPVPREIPEGQVTPFPKPKYLASWWNNE